MHPARGSVFSHDYVTLSHSKSSGFPYTGLVWTGPEMERAQAEFCCGSNSLFNFVTVHLSEANNDCRAQSILLIQRLGKQSIDGFHVPSSFSKIEY